MDFKLRKGGLTRIPNFVRDVIAAVKSEQASRPMLDDESLISPAVQSSDFTQALILGVIILMLRILLQKFVFTRLFRRYSPKLRAKMSENLCYTIYYIIAFAYFVATVMPNVAWGDNIWQKLISNDSVIMRELCHPRNPDMVPEERWYLIQGAAFYMSATVFLLAFDTRRSDYAQMLCHHAVTMAMIVASYLYGYIRTGMIALALHDVGDIFLYSSKFFHELGVSGVDIGLFVCFAVTFYITRLVMYSRLVHSVTVEAMQLVAVNPSFNTWGMYFDTYFPLYVFFVFCLNTLLYLHCFWYTLVLRLIADELFYGKKITDQGDLRSDDEGDEEVEAFEEDEDDAIARKKIS